MKVLITGATGLLGGHLIKELQQRNEQIRALVLPVENADHLLKQGVEVVRGDITDASTLAPAVQDIDLIFHLAGMMGVWRPLSDYRLVNVNGSENLYKAAQKASVHRFVHTSSHTVYNITNDHPLTQQEIFDAIADAIGARRITRHLPYLPIYYGAFVAEKIVAPLTHTKPLVSQLGAMMFGSDNKHSIDKARRELGFEPKVELREGIKLAAAWFNAGGMDKPLVTEASQNAPLAGTASR